MRALLVAVAGTIAVVALTRFARRIAVSERLRTLSEGLLEAMPTSGAIVNTASTAGHIWRKQAKEINELLDLGQ